MGSLDVIAGGRSERVFAVDDRFGIGAYRETVDSSIRRLFDGLVDSGFDADERDLEEVARIIVAGAVVGAVDAELASRGERSRSFAGLAFGVGGVPVEDVNGGFGQSARHVVFNIERELFTAEGLRALRASEAWGAAVKAVCAGLFPAVQFVLGDASALSEAEEAARLYGPELDAENVKLYLLPGYCPARPRLAALKALAMAWEVMPSCDLAEFPLALDEETWVPVGPASEGA